MHVGVGEPAVVVDEEEDEVECEVGLDPTVVVLFASGPLTQYLKMT